MEPDEIHPRVVRELGEFAVSLFSVSYQWYWRSAEIPVNWKLADVFCPSKRVRKDSSNYRPASLWCLVKLQRRLFCEVLKNSWKTKQSCIGNGIAYALLENQHFFVSDGRNLENSCSVAGNKHLTQDSSSPSLHQYCIKNFNMSSPNLSVREM